MYVAPDLSSCLNVSPRETVSVFELPVDVATASENSLLYPPLTSTPIPKSVLLTLTPTLKPSVLVKVVVVPLVMVEEAEAVKSKAMVQTTPLQGSALPSTCCFPDLLYSGPFFSLLHCWRY